MERVAAPPSADRRGLLLGAIVAGEVALLLAGAWSPSPLLGAGVALAIAFFLLAYRAPEAAWACVWIATPFSIEWSGVGGWAVAFPTEPMIALSLAAWGLRAVATGGARLPASPLHAPLALLGTVLLASVVASPFWVAGLKAWIAAASYVVFGYLYFAVTPCDRGRAARWVRLAAITGAAWALYGVVRLLAVGVSSANAYGAARPFFTEHGTYAAFLALLLPLPLLTALERRGRARLAYGGVALAVLLAIFLSFTRAAWLSVLVVLPPALVLWARRTGRWGALAVPAAAAALAVLAVVGVGAADRLTRHAGTVVDSENVSNLERLNRWMAAAEMTRDRPWLGVGYGAYPEAYASYRRKTIVTELAYRHMGAHSEPLRLLSETGALGLAAALWFLGTVFAAGIRAARRPGWGGTLALALLAGLGTYAVHGLFNSYLGIDKVTVPFWMAVGALAALSGESGRR